MPKALSALIAVAFVLAGCGGGSSLTGVPQTMGTNAQAHRDSWLKPGSSGGDLMYVADGTYDVWVLSFPGAQVVGDLAAGSRPWGLCSDSKGDVFVTESDKVVEYAHGGTSPINTLSADGAFSCSWDPSTGNLAVVERPNSIAIFPNGSGSPEVYTDDNFLEFNYCAYDGNGDLFADGEAEGSNPSILVELDTTSGTFSDISLNEKIYLQDLQWDGKYLAIDDDSGRSINRIKVSGTTGTVEGTTHLSGATFYGYWTWLEGGTFISPIFTGGHDDKAMDFWSYPSGGKPSKRLPRSDFKSKGPIRGMTVSVPPT